MTAGELQQYLHAHIPLTAAMQVHVVSSGFDAVHLSAPLAPNINHRHTGFGGSISALAIVSAWSVVHLGLLRTSDFGARIVIQKNAISYLRPIEGDFAAISPGPTREDWAKFLEGLRRKGRGRLTLRSTIFADGTPAAEFAGTFVAIRTDQP